MMAGKRTFAEMKSTETPSNDDVDGGRESLDSMLDYEEKSKFETHGHKIRRDLVGSELVRLRNKQRPTTRLHQYQIEAVLAVEEHFSEPKDDIYGPAAMIVAPPGSGKSGMVTLLPYFLDSKKVFVLTPSKIISEQISNEFGFPDITKAFFKKSGMMENTRSIKNMLETVTLLCNVNDIKNIGHAKLVVTNAQKFGGKAGLSLSSIRTPEEQASVREILADFDTVIVDEAHHYPAATWKNFVNVFKGKKVIFLTATPFRGTTGNEVSMLMDKSLKKVYEIPTSKLENVTIRAIEFTTKPARSEDLLSPEFLTQLREDVDTQLAKHRAQESRGDRLPQALILVSTKDDAKKVAQGLGPVIISDCKDSVKNLYDFTKGDKRIGIVCGMLREGYDNSNVTLVVILKKCRSRVMFEQFAGRCMRIRRDLTGKAVDKAVGTVMSYDHFEQGVMWDARLKMAEEDPIDDDEDNEVEGENGNEA